VALFEQHGAVSCVARLDRLELVDPIESTEGRHLRDGRRRDVEVRRSMGRMSASGTTSQPMRQPVMLKYFEKLLTTIASSEWVSAVSAGASYSSP
jgi:hypothetical protein